MPSMMRTSAGHPRCVHAVALEKEPIAWIRAWISSSFQSIR